MKTKGFLLSMILLLIVGFSLVGCATEDNEDTNDSTTIVQEQGWVLQSYWFESNKTWDDYYAIPTAVWISGSTKYSEYSETRKVYVSYFITDKKIYYAIYVRG